MGYMDTQLVFSQEGNLYLNTSMTQSAFTKSRLVQHMNEKGCLARRKAGSWTFAPWSFTGTVFAAPEQEEGQSAAAIRAGGTVLLEGKGFTGCTLHALLESGNKAHASFAGAAVCAAIECALEQGAYIPPSGGGGIFIAQDFDSIIFLPSGLLETALLCAGGETFSKNQGMYVNRALKGDAALSFIQAAVAYRLLAGEFPFPAKNEDEREEDLYDGNYIPAARRVWALDEKLAAGIDNALRRAAGGRSAPRITAASAITEGSRPGAQSAEQARRAGLHFPLRELYRELGLNEDGSLPPDGNLSPVIHKATVSQEAFEAETERWRARFAKQLDRKRFFRHNRTTVAVIAAVTVLLIFCTALFISGNMGKPTSKGLSAVQTAEMFYSALNTMDVSAAGACSSGKQTGNIVDMVGTFYVTAKTQATYNAQLRTLSPAEWLNSANPQYRMFGLTQFMAGNAKGELYFQGPEKRSRPKAIAEDGGTPVSEGSAKSLQTSYCLVYQEGEDGLTVTSYEDILTLTFKNRRWIITGLSHSSETTQTLSAKAFADEFTAAVSQQGDTLKAVEALRERYPWLPSNSEIIAAADYAQQVPAF